MELTEADSSEDEEVSEKHYVEDAKQLADLCLLGLGFII